MHCIHIDLQILSVVLNISRPTRDQYRIYGVCVWGGGGGGGGVAVGVYVAAVVGKQC